MCSSDLYTLGRHEGVIACPLSAAVVCAGIQVCKEYYYDAESDEDDQAKTNIILLFDDHLQFHETLHLTPKWLVNNKICPPDEIEWWYSIKIGRLEFCPPLEISIDDSIDRAWQLLNSKDKKGKSADFLIVYELSKKEEEYDPEVAALTGFDSSEFVPRKNIIGIISRQELSYTPQTSDTRAIHSRDRVRDYPDLISKSFWMAGMDTTLGQLVEAFQQSYYCIIFTKNTQKRSPDTPVVHQNLALGTVTVVEFFKYITQTEKHHKEKDNYDMNASILTKFDFCK